MNRRVFGLLLGSITLIVGCNGGDSGGTQQAPRRDEWSLVIDQPFPVFDADGLIVIGDLTIGGEEVSDNFANRGDVIVEYVPMDPGAERIQVQMRRFTMAASDESAKADFEALQIWAYDSGTTPKAPADMDEEDNCRDPNRALPWRTGCEVRVYYEGMNQLDRAGADLRVTLPSSWIGDLEVITEDNAEDSDYHNRGNVCISQVPGSVEVVLGNGEAFITLADAATEIPECPAADFAACQMSGFDPACPCLGGSNPYTFASAKVLSHDASAANMTVDVPPAPFWSSVNLTNEGPNQMKSMAGGNNCAEEEGLCCQATIDPSVGAFLIDEIAVGTEVTRNPWRNKGSINYPGMPAVDGAGYNIQLTSKDCQAITATEDPADFVGKGLGTEQDTAERGNLTVCAGCIRGRSCDDLLPGG